METETKREAELNGGSHSVERLLGLVADIRAAVGNPTGKLMQDELVAHCHTINTLYERRGNRLALLARVQKHMRDPERTLVCDILANGQLLPDPNGKRYGFAATGNEHLCRPNSVLNKTHSE